MIDVTRKWACISRNTTLAEIMETGDEMSEKIRKLRTELQEAKEVITVQHMALEDYGITHDQQAQEIELLRKQRDTLITALDKCKFDSCNLPIDQWREVCIALANIKETK